VAWAVVGLGPGASEEELRAAQAAVRNPELLAWLKNGSTADLPAGEVRAALNKKDGIGSLPIHDVLCDKATGPELVCAMLDAGGEAMLGVPASGNALPLHVAAYFSRSPAVVEILLARGPPGALRAENKAGNTPLAHAEEHNRGPGAEEIKLLLRAAMR
jgi:hypothetical protein